MRTEITQALAKQGDARGDAFAVVIKQYIKSKDEEGAREVLASSVAETAPDFNVNVAKKVLAAVADALKEVEDIGMASVAEEALRLIGTRAASFEEHDMLLRDNLAALLTAADDFSGAARILAGIDLRSHKISDSERAKRLVAIAELYLEEGMPVDAEAFVNRASHVITENKDQVVQSRYRVCYARMLDARRKFIEAAARYYELSTISTIGESVVDESDLAGLLSKSLICAILASAGPQKSRMLGQLVKDERTREVNGGKYFNVLEKMYADRFVRKAEVRPVEEILERHQKATLPDGSTILERALMEHNIVAASKVYDNISFAGLAEILEIDTTNAEKIVSKMISEGRLQGSIDQIDGILTFSNDSSLKKGQSTQGEAGKPFVVTVSEDFDMQISQFCDSVNGVVEKIIARYPQIA